MSVAVAAPWEFGYVTPYEEYEYWKFMLGDLEIEGFWMTPVSGIDKGANTKVQEAATFEEIIANYRSQGYDIVFVDEGGVTGLADFVHPTDVLYCFGRSNYSPMSLAEPGDASVKIETPVGSGGFWSHQAASIVLYDRYRKSWP